LVKLNDLRLHEAGQAQQHNVRKKNKDHKKAEKYKWKLMVMYMGCIVQRVARQLNQTLIAEMGFFQCLNSQLFKTKPPLACVHSYNATQCSLF